MSMKHEAKCSLLIVLYTENLRRCPSAEAGIVNLILNFEQK